MADLVLVFVIGVAALVIALLVAILVQVRRGRGEVSAHELGSQVAQSMSPYLQVLQPLKQQADQRLPLIEKYTSDIGAQFLASQKQRQEEEKLVRESLAKLHEITKHTPQVAQQVLVLQTQLQRLQVVEQGVQDLTKLFLTTQGRGAMGEEAVRAQFHALPPDMWSEQHPLGGGKVDFVVHMPNKRVLPIESKTSGLQPILEYFAVSERLLETTDPVQKEDLVRQQARLQTRIRQAVLARTYEVASYIRPEEGTLGLALQAVPDSLYAILDIKTRKESSEQSVQIVPYNLLLPLIHILRSQNQFDRLDFQATVAAMQGIRLQTNLIRDVLVNKFEKAHKFLDSGIGDVRSALGAIDQNSERLATPTTDERLPVRAVRAKLHQKGLDRP